MRACSCTHVHELYIRLCMYMYAHAQGTVCACPRLHAIQENMFVIRTYLPTSTLGHCQNASTIFCEALEHVPSHIPTFTKLKRGPWHEQHCYFTPNDVIGMFIMEAWKNKILAYPGRSLGKPSEIVENPMFTRSLTSDLDLQEVRFRSLTSALVLHQGGPTFCRAANAYIGTDVCKVAFFRIEAMDGQLVFLAKNKKRSSPQSNPPGGLLRAPGTKSLAPK